MEYYRQTIDSAELSGVFNLPKALHNKAVEVIVLLIEDNLPENPKPKKRPLGFAKGAEVPDSFFEPLSEEDLQLWGL